jgi:hypothetical protein
MPSYIMPILIMCRELFKNILIYYAFSNRFFHCVEKRKVFLQPRVKKISLYTQVGATDKIDWKKIHVQY